MQNLGENKIVAMIQHEEALVKGINSGNSGMKAYPTGMVVFYERTTYDADGFNTSGDIKPSQVAVVHAFMAPGKSASSYKVAGVTFVDRGHMGDSLYRHATVHIGGSVTFCNTGCSVISAGDEVWAKMSDKLGTEPEVVPRSRVETAIELEKLDYQYVGLCVMGCAPSIMNIGRLNFGQLVIGRHT